MNARHRWFEPGLVLGLVVLVLWSLAVGTYPVSIAQLLDLLRAALTGAAPPDAEIATVVEVLRLPRVALAVLCGGCLGLCGGCLQGVMRNPLVGPDIVGVSAGATCGGVFAIFFDASPAVLIAAAFAGGLCALIIAFLIARAAGSSALALVLSGVVVSAFCSAFVALALTLAQPDGHLERIVYWTLGSFAGATSQKVAMVALPALVAGGVLLGLRWRINVMSLGETDANALGIDVGTLRWLVIGMVSLLVGAQVAVSGGVGWVGLIVPHFVRMVVGPDHRRLLPACVLVGGIFMLAVDNVARLLGSGELPIGLLTAFVGAPVFCIVLWQTRSRGWGQ